MFHFVNKIKINPPVVIITLIFAVSSVATAKQEKASSELVTHMEMAVRIHIVAHVYMNMRANAKLKGKVLRWA